MALRRTNDLKSGGSSERPHSSFISTEQPSQQRPPMKNRFSSPPGSLILCEQELDSEYNTALRVPSPDVGRRPGLSRRHYYGSLETLNTVNSSYETSGVMSKFRIENGEICGAQNGSTSPSQGTVVHLENPEFQTRWYFKYFLGKVHQNYIGVDGKQNPFILSICLTAADNYNVPQYRAILWRKTGSEKKCLPYHANKPVSPKVIIQSFGIEKCEKGPKEVLSPEFQQELLTLEEQEGSVNFKFGVLYAKAGQTSDDEMFSNETGSEEFNHFLDLLGDRITLQGWQRYRGGLDVKNDMTGSHSVYTVYEGHEIMFHVSSLLPYTPDNPQQVERKRHIGNDIVTVVFQDTENEDDKPSFTPMGVKSKFIHVFVLVTYIKSDDRYRVTIFTEKNVPIFGPPLPCPTVFHNHQEFRNFLLVKLINGEKAAYSSPIFSSRRQRTLESLITRLCQEHMHEKIGVRKSWSDAISDQPRGNKRKEREQLFVQYGQSLKLKTIMKGDAPTSLVTTSANVKAEPWQQQNVYEDFPHKILCGDSWGDALVLGTENGIYVIVGDTIRQLFDKAIISKQLSVVEAYGLLLFRVDKGKEFHNSRICVFKLFNFEDEDQVVKAKDDCKQHKLAKTKGCHSYAVSHTSGSQPLFMGVACGRKVLLLKWKYPVVWNTSAAAATSNTRDLIEGFVVVKEVTLSDPPLLMSVTLAANKDPLVCVGYKYHFDLIRHTGEITRIHSVDTQKKTTLVSVVDVYEDEEPELLLSFNHHSVFKRLNGEQSSNFYFNWNSAPRWIVCAFPYLLAFTNTTIEIRLVVNGNLVHTLALPKLELITSKWDIYFTASPPKATNVFSNDQTTSQSSSSPPSPTLPRQHSCIYKISLYSLMGQFLSPTQKSPEQFPEFNDVLNQGQDAEDGQEEASCDPVESPKLEDNSKPLVQKKDALSRTRSCPIPERENLSVFSEEVELWGHLGSSGSQTLKT